MESEKIKCKVCGGESLEIILQIIEDKELRRKLYFIGCKDCGAFLGTMEAMIKKYQPQERILK